MDKVLQMNEFFVEGTNPNKSHVLLNITEPSTNEEKEKGYFFAICEIENADNKYILKIQEIVDSIENGYYELDDLEDKNSLEQVLDKINQKSFSIIKENVGLNCLVGAIKGNDLIYSFYGNPQILLFYKDKSDNYKRIDLLDGNLEEDEEGSDRVFSQIIQGKINKNDYFFVATEKVEKYFSQDRLQKIISSRPPRQSTEHLERVLKELKNDVSFGGMIIHLQKTVENSIKKITSPVKKGSAKSLNKLFSSQKDTASILSPSILPRIGKNKEEGKVDNKQETVIELTKTKVNSNHVKSRSDNTDKNEDGTLKTPHKKGKLDIFKIIGSVIVTIGRYLYILLLFIINIIVKFGHGLLGLYFITTNHRNKRREVIQSWKQGWKNVLINIKQVPWFVKILLFLAVGVLIALSVSISLIQAKKADEKQKQVFSSQIKEINDKLDLAESYLIYDEGDKALKTMQEAKQTLASADCINVENVSICSKTSTSIEEMLNKLRKMYTVSVNFLTDFDALQKEKTASKLLLLEKQLIAMSKEQAELFSYDLLSKESKIIHVGVNGSLGFKSQAVPKENDYILLIDNNNDAVYYDNKDKIWKSVEISYPNENVDISGSFVYSRRLYNIDKTNKQIYRHDAINSGFGKGVEWITKSDGIDLSNAVDLAIDGDVYAANKNGQVYKLAKGSGEIFSISGLDPKLDNIDKIWTYFELKYLYILDGKNKRLLIVDKSNGSLKKQLTAKEWVNPTSMVIDENNNTGYILDDNKLYQIELGL